MSKLTNLVENVNFSQNLTNCRYFLFSGGKGGGAMDAKFGYISLTFVRYSINFFYIIQFSVNGFFFTNVLYYKINSLFVLSNLSSKIS